MGLGNRRTSVLGKSGKKKESEKGKGAPAIKAAPFALRPNSFV